MPRSTPASSSFLVATSCAVLALLAGVGLARAQTGPAQPIRVSTGWDGTAANGPSSAPAIDAAATCVAFQSEATNLVVGDSNGVQDVFVRDLASATTTRVSVATSGDQANGTSFDPRVSGNCRFVVFASHASNLVEGDTNGVADVSVHDRATLETTRVSVFGAEDTQATRGCSSPDISADGRYVVFDTAENPLVGRTAVVLHDRQSSLSTLVPVAGDTRSRRPAISSNGRYVALMTYTRGSVPGDIYDDRAWLHDRDTGTTRELAVVGGPEVGMDLSGRPAIDGEGRFVSYVVAQLPVPSMLSPLPSVAVHDTVTGQVRGVNAEHAENPPNRPGLTCSARSCDATMRPALAAGGRQVAYAVLSPDPTYVFDLYTSDLVDGTTVFLGSIRSAAPGGAATREVAPSANGLTVAFVATDVGNVYLDSVLPQVFVLSLDSDGDTMPDAWEHTHGLDPYSPADATRDADGDGRSNLLEHQEGAHPRGLYRQYLAEGAISAFFSAGISLAAIGAPASAVVEFQRADGTVTRATRRVWADRPEHVDVGSVPGMETAEFSTLVESDVPVIVRCTSQRTS